MKKLFLILHFFGSSFLFSQADSLYKVYNNTLLPDSIRFSAAHNIANELVYNYPDSTLKLAFEYHSLAEKKKDHTWQGAACMTIGNAYYMKGEYSTALNWLNKGLLIAPKNQQILIASLYSSMGTVYYGLADYSHSLDFHFRSLKIRQAEEDIDEGISFLNIGAVYSQMGDYKRSSHYHFRALKLYERLRISWGQAMALSNLSSNFLHEKNYGSAMTYQKKSLAIEEENNNPAGIAESYDIIGAIHLEQGQYLLAEINFNKALKIKKEIGNIQAEAVTLTKLAQVSLKQKNYKKALEVITIAKEISNKVQDLATYNEIQNNLVDIYKGLGKPEKALTELEAYLILKDSLFEDERKREAALKSMQYEFDQKENDLKTEQKIKNAIDAEEQRKQRMVIYGVSAILLLTLVLAGVIFKSLQANKRKNKIITEQKLEVEKQKEIVEHQKEIVVEKQKEILDSIKYAKRIQRAHLPTEKYIVKSLGRLTGKKT